MVSFFYKPAVAQRREPVNKGLGEKYVQKRFFCEKVTTSRLIIDRYIQFLVDSNKTMTRVTLWRKL